MTQAILLIRGLPGSGKSTIARALAAATGAVHCEADDYFVVHGVPEEAIRAMRERWEE